ncbi:MAG: endonuclease/exonuclease/phosphatase family protein [Candidatus Calescibacterium sp.]|nr:endonuclease/exonuclease/phosphatase family protein [Candidatus Calescibacterium sp.]MDW8132282.1 endonuclease/exonuclease/phosphatase family protein [Candidatus Calescibacterium sp.]
MINIKVTTYNVENLFDRFDDPLKDDGPPKSEASKKALAEVLKSLDSDIVALQEVENTNIVREVLVLAGLKDRYNVIVGKSDGRGIACALLVDKKFPIKSYTINEKEDVFYRPPVEAIVEIMPGFDMKFVSVHFKAKMNPESQEQRKKEARRTIELVNKSKIPTVILGDYNDLPFSEVSQIFEKNGFIDVRNVDKLSKDIDVPTHYYQPMSMSDVYASHGPSIVDYIRISDSVKNLVIQGTYDVVDEKEKPEVVLASDHRPISIVLGGFLKPFAEFKNRKE